MWRWSRVNANGHSSISLSSQGKWWLLWASWAPQYLITVTSPQRHGVSNRQQFNWLVKKVLLDNNLTHWGRATHICVGKLTIIGSDNGLSPGRRQAIIWTIAGILLIGTLGTNFSAIVIEIRPFSFKKMHLKMSSGKWRPFCLNVLSNTKTPNYWPFVTGIHRWTMDSRNKEPVMRLVFPCHGFIMSPNRLG